MSRICLYLDEDTIKTALVKALRNADLDVVTVAEVGMLGYPDKTIWDSGLPIADFGLKTSP